MSKDDLRASKLRASTVDTVRQKTAIWKEEVSKASEFHAENVWCHGYNLFELADKRSIDDVFFLLFTGQLPDEEQKRLLNAAMIIFINPGPRHPATRVGVTAAASMTYPEHLLPLVVSAFGGNQGGAGRIADCFSLLEERSGDAIESLAADLAEDYQAGKEYPSIPGIGGEYGHASEWTRKCLIHFTARFEKIPVFGWLSELDSAVRKFSENSWGACQDLLMAAILRELGFSKSQCIGVYQILAAPGMYAHTAEYINKPSTSLPFIQDKNYVIE